MWRNSSSEINNELYKGYRYGNSERKINELLSGYLFIYLPLLFDMISIVYCRAILIVVFLAAYDFSNSNMNNFNVSIWYNSTFKNDTGNSPIALLRLPRSVNLVYI